MSSALDWENSRSGTAALFPVQNCDRRTDGRTDGRRRADRNAATATQRDVGGKLILGHADPASPRQPPPTTGGGNRGFVAGEGQKNICPPENFGFRKMFDLSKNFRPIMHKLRLKPRILIIFKVAVEVFKHP